MKDKQNKACKRYITIGVRHPRQKKNDAWTPERRLKHGKMMAARMDNPAYKANFIQKQKENNHPWRAAFQIFGAKVSPNYLGAKKQ